jgi:hypothetical protein
MEVENPTAVFGEAKYSWSSDQKKKKTNKPRSERSPVDFLKQLGRGERGRKTPIKRKRASFGKKPTTPPCMEWVYLNRLHHAPLPPGFTPWVRTLK